MKYYSLYYNTTRGDRLYVCDHVLPDNHRKVRTYFPSLALQFTSFREALKYRLDHFNSNWHIEENYRSKI